LVLQGSCGGPPQAPLRQDCPLRQSASLAHGALHCPVVASQAYGAQITVGPGTQLPAPSQTWIPVTAPFAQVPGRHVVARYRRHAPDPSQVPSNPQVAGACTGQSPARRGGEPATRSRHIPTAPGAEQVWQPPLQADVQQTPSTQNPLAQSRLLVHEASTEAPRASMTRSTLASPPSSAAPPAPASRPTGWPAAPPAPPAARRALLPQATEAAASAPASAATTQRSAPRPAPEGVRPVSPGAARRPWRG